MQSKTFWDKFSEREKYQIMNKRIILINCLALIIPDYIYFRNNNFNNIPTLSHNIIDPIPRLIHLIIWYFGYFQRMKTLTKISIYYSFFHYSQQMGWIVANIFPETSGRCVKIHNIATIATFVNYAIMKIFFCKNRITFGIGFGALLYCYMKPYEHLIGIIERFCIYHVIFTLPDVTFKCETD